MFKLVKKILSKEGVLHFRRWAIFECKWFNIYIHCISQSDQDTSPHSHPWSFLSFILKGSYGEELVDAKAAEVGMYPWFVKLNHHKVGNILFRRAKDFHRITLTSPQVWTLVVTGPATDKDNWGYCTQTG